MLAAAAERLGPAVAVQVSHEAQPHHKTILYQELSVEYLVLLHREVGNGIVRRIGACGVIGRANSDAVLCKEALWLKLKCVSTKIHFTKNRSESSTYQITCAGLQLQRQASSLLEQLCLSLISQRPSGRWQPRVAIRNVTQSGTLSLQSSLLLLQVDLRELLLSSSSRWCRRRLCRCWGARCGSRGSGLSLRLWLSLSSCRLLWL